MQRLMGQASNGDVARTSFTVDYTATAATDDGAAWKIALAAKDPGVAYARVDLWVDKTSYELRHADFFVTSGNLIKRAHYRGQDEIEIKAMLPPANRTTLHK